MRVALQRREGWREGRRKGGREREREREEGMEREHTYSIGAGFTDARCGGNTFQASADEIRYTINWPRMSAFISVIRIHHWTCMHGHLPICRSVQSVIYYILWWCLWTTLVTSRHFSSPNDLYPLWNKSLGKMSIDCIVRSIHVWRFQQCHVKLTLSNPGYSMIGKPQKNWWRSFSSLVVVSLNTGMEPTEKCSGFSTLQYGISALVICMSLGWIRCIKNIASIPLSFSNKL